jgi:hypothetical protein
MDVCFVNQHIITFDDPVGMNPAHVDTLMFWPAGATAPVQIP